MNKYEKKNPRLAAMNLDFADEKVRCPLCKRRVDSARKLRAHQRTKGCQYEASKLRVKRLGFVPVDNFVGADLRANNISVEVVRGYGRGYNSGTTRHYSHPWVAAVLNAGGLHRRPRYKGLALAWANLRPDFRKALLAVEALGGNTAVGQFILSKFEQPAPGGPSCSRPRDLVHAVRCEPVGGRPNRAHYTEIDLTAAMAFMRRNLEPPSEEQLDREAAYKEMKHQAALAGVAPNTRLAIVRGNAQRGGLNETT